MSDAIVVTKNRVVPLEKIRNIGVIAHIDAGKTTTTERVLFYTGKTHKIGDIDDGTTVTDWMEQERERGITIVSAAITTFWGDTRFNLIDTPGHVDFTAEVERSLRVLDGAIMVFDAEEGVQAQSETVWHQADKYQVPRLVFINKMDKLGADFFGTTQMISERLGTKLAIVDLPVGKEKDFKGVILVLEEKMLIWGKDPLGVKYDISDVPDEYQEQLQSVRKKLIEDICAEDEALMEKYFAGQSLTVEELKAGLRKATIANKLVPIYAGTSLRNMGVQPLLDGVVDFLPSPLEVPPMKGTNPKTQKEEERPPEIKAPFSALLFKVQTDPHVGKLFYLRIYSGTLKSSSAVLNTSNGSSERVGRLLLMHANKREGLEEAYAGEIVAVIGLKDCRTGDTLCDPAHPIVLESISFPDPVISLAIEPETKSDQEKLGISLNKLADEDPTFKTKIDHETGQTIISGMGELHLEILVDRMKREFGVNVNIGKPQVAYRETITQEAVAEGKFVRQSGGRGQYGHCWLRVAPREKDAGFEFKSEIKGAAIPNNFIPAIEKGVKEAVEKGVVAGFPLVDISVAVYDGSYHEVDSSEQAFKIAGSMALQAAVKKAAPILLEPIMKLEVSIPEEFLGPVIGDLSSRRAQILGTESRGNFAKLKVIKGNIPLEAARGYATVLRSLTQGRGSFYMEPLCYNPVPKSIEEQIASANAPKQE
ncbi:MAG: elongation factor G [Patescibacteria group bacterium]